MPTPLIGDRPQTTLERQQRWRERQAERAALAQEAVQFVLSLHPDEGMPKRALKALQRRLSAISPEN